MRIRLIAASSVLYLGLTASGCGDDGDGGSGFTAGVGTTTSTAPSTTSDSQDSTEGDSQADSGTGDGDGDGATGDGDTGDGDSGDGDSGDGDSGDGDSGDGDSGDGDTGDGDSGDGDSGDGDSGDGDTGDGDSGDGDSGDGDSGDGDSGDGDTTTGDGDGDGGIPCMQCSMTIASQQSGGIIVNGANVFATASLSGEVVYAMGDHGSGRFIASADSSLPFKEVTDCPITEWLAGTTNTPSILIFGWGPSDGPGTWPPGSDIQGIHLPAQYINDPMQLRADYDIVVYLEGSGQFGTDEPSDDEVNTVLDYIDIHGGGAYITSEFLGYLNTADYTSVNRFMEPMGVEAKAISLNWGGVDGEIEFECFPPVPE